MKYPIPGNFKMKIFLTGASGILGSDIENQLKQDNHEVLAFNSSNIDLGNFPGVKNKMNDFKPDMVVHSAAMTNVDLCEDNKNAAILTNIIGSKNIAMAASRLNAKIVYISSCGVYGSGKTAPYNELDNTNPQTYHHYTKLEGEKRVKEHNNNFLVIRPGWLFGGTVYHKKNFVEARRKEATKSALISSAMDKIGSPTYTGDLAKQIIFLINQDLVGTFNVVNEGCASRFEYVAEIVKLLGLDTRVEPVNSNSFPRKANMPDNECLENLNLNLINANLMRSWKDALKDYITSTYNL
jgi:dTDP-4-dehydrorhamnose reductase